MIRRGRPPVAEAEQLSGKILDASWEVLLAQGFEAFTFDRVARHAHIGKATIYSRFAGKRELLEALLERRVAMRTDAVRSTGESLPAEEAFRLRAAGIISQLFSPDGVLLERLLDWLEQESGASGESVRAAAYRNAIDSIIETLDAAARQGAIMPVNRELAARFWLEGMLGHVRVAMVDGPAQPHEIDAWAARYSRFFFGGLRALAESPDFAD